MTNNYNFNVAKTGSILLFFISIFSYGQNDLINYEISNTNGIFSETKCITNRFDFSSASIKITEGDSSAVKNTSLTIILNGRIEEHFSSLDEFSDFKFRDWLFEHASNNRRSRLLFDYFILLKDNSFQKLKKEYCVKRISTVEHSVNKELYVKLPIFFATDRDYDKSQDLDEQFGHYRAKLKYGLAEVSIPKSHKVGEIESPSYWRFEFRENPDKHIVVHSIDVLNKYNFYTKLSKRIDKSAKKSTFLFVHGYNVSFIDAAKRTAQMTYDLKFDGASVFYSWPSYASTGSYTRDEANIEWSKKNIETFLKDYLSTTNAEEIYLIAHSMGNRGLTKAIISVVSENPALRSKIKEIILAAPDIDADVFKRDIAPKMVSIIEKPITLYVSSGDVALKASRVIHGSPRAGDSKDSILVVEGVETIDASSVDTSFMGHSYFSESKTILDDIFDLIKTSNRASFRKKLKEINKKGVIFWKMKG